jgi:predicted regulator of Ras-like GTPase activity (Roadblock/LC7/MglB family)
MREHAIREMLRSMAAREGFLVAGLVEIEGGMVWHAEGSESLSEAVVSNVSDYWRLYRRSKDAFATLGPMNVAMLFHRDGRITVCECGPDMLLVVITTLRNEIDWELWKQDYARLAHLIKTF